MPTIEDIQAQIVEDFSLLPQWEERYAYLIELGQKMPPMPDGLKTEENIVRGCQSTVWLHKECRDNIVHLAADSDSLIVKGLAALLMRVYSDQPARQAATAQLTFFDETGLNKHLSSQRANGLMAMIDEIRKFAIHCAAGEG